MGVHFPVDIPEDEPVLFNEAIGIRSLQVGGVPEMTADEIFMAPIDQGAQILQPLSKTGVLGL